MRDNIQVNVVSLSVLNISATFNVSVVSSDEL